MLTIHRADENHCDTERRVPYESMTLAEQLVKTLVVLLVLLLAILMKWL